MKFWRKIHPSWLLVWAASGVIIWAILRAVIIGTGENSSEIEDFGLSDIMFSARDWFAGRIESIVPETEAKLGLSYLLGLKAGLPKDLSESLRAVGLTHIVVASGAHLAILVEIAKKIFGKISRFAGVLFSGVLIVLFMAMVGWTPSILRAGVMSVLTLITWYFGRKMAPWRIILLTAAGTLLINPDFITNLGWLLSFASFIGIMILGPKVTRFFYGKKKPGFIASMIITTISATLMTLPITLYYFGQISLISVQANLLILPTLPYAMGLTFLTGVLADIPGLGTIISWCATKLLDFHIFIVELFGEWTQFLIKIEKYQMWVCQDTVNGRRPNGRRLWLTQKEGHFLQRLGIRLRLRHGQGQIQR